MKKIIYYFAYLLLLFFISILPTSAKEYDFCIRTEDNLFVESNLIYSNNKDNILKTPCVDTTIKVYDFADLLTDTEEDEIFDLVTTYIQETNYDLVLVTINENSKYTAREYADDFFDYNEFGINKTRDGVLILIDMDTRELYISTSGFAIKMYDDYRIERVLDSGYLYITDEEYYSTFSNMINSLTSYYESNFPNSNQNIEIDELGNIIYIKHIPYQLVFVIAIIITVIISLILYNKSRLKIKAISTVSYMKNKEITLRNDNFINSIVTKTRRASEGSSYSSSGRSSSSSHRSSSGRSHGGGGRKF